MPRILACVDADSVGSAAAAQIGMISEAVRVAQIPIGKDMNEFYLHTGDQAVAEWLTKKLR